MYRFILSNKSLRWIFVYIFISFPGTIFSHEKNFNEKIESFLLNNPKVILKSLENLEIREAKNKEDEIKKTLVKNLPNIIKPYANTFSGNENSKKIIVEFLDYNCGYCKKAHQEVRELLNDLSDLKVVYINLPILSDRSKELAKLSMAVSETNMKNFNEFHNFLLNSKRIPNDDQIKNFLSNIKLDYKQIKIASDSKKINKTLENDFLLARELGIQGTPAFIINNEIIPGYVGKKIMTKLIAD